MGVCRCDVNCIIGQRDALRTEIATLNDKLEDMVTRNAAIRALDLVCFVACEYHRNGGFTRPVVILEEYQKHVIPFRRFAPGPDTTPWIQMMDAALALAEFESNTPKKGTE